MNYAHHSYQKNQHLTNKICSNGIGYGGNSAIPIPLLEIKKYQVVILDQYLNRRLIPLTKKAEP